MEYGIENAKRDLPGFQEWLNRLAAIALSFLHQPNLGYRGTEPFKFMSLCFATKQLDHHTSMVSLSGRRDMLLIARSMLEGAAQLAWAAQDPDVRATQWLDFVAVHDWRLHLRRQREGVSTDPARLERILQRRASLGDAFLTKKAHDAKEAKRPMPTDPFTQNWTGMTARQLFQSVGMTLEYDHYYKPFSDWSHWASSGFASSLSHRQEGTMYDATSPEDQVYALIIEFFSLFTTLQIADHHHGKHFRGQLRHLNSLYQNWHNTRPKPSPSADDNPGSA
jgi:hypothetical protein